MLTYKEAFDVAENVREDKEIRRKLGPAYDDVSVDELYIRALERLWLTLPYPNSRTQACFIPGTNGKRFPSKPKLLGLGILAILGIPLIFLWIVGMALCSLGELVYSEVLYWKGGDDIG